MCVDTGLDVRKLRIFVDQGMNPEISDNEL
jgi:hypothetical protein